MTLMMYLKILDDFIDDMGIEYFGSDNLASIDKAIFSRMSQANICCNSYSGATRSGEHWEVLILLFYYSAERCNSDSLQRMMMGSRVRILESDLNCQRGLLMQFKDSGFKSVRFEIEKEVWNKYELSDGALLRVRVIMAICLIIKKR